MLDNNYINIQGWMVNRLKLKGNKLIIFALIYGFSQDGTSKFNGSFTYIEQTTNLSRVSVNDTINSLIEDGLVLKTQKFYDGQNRNFYEVNHNILGSLETIPPNIIGSKESLLGSKETIPLGSKESLQTGSKESLLYNNIYNTNNLNNKDIINNSAYAPQKNFKKPLLEEVIAYCKERNNNVDAEKWFDYYTANGFKVGRSQMKDWKAAVRNWEKNNYDKPKQQEQAGKYAGMSFSSK